ncbi:MAG: RNA methyltransferase [Peptococcaceae bacterium BRH_c4b]|nr:MAG: RNA methyltransferase [Peptococcaceae bacterium BRH_c4b]
MSGTKTRLDVMLHEKGLFESREKARAAIMAGQITVDGAKAQKPGQATDPEAKIEIRGSLPYVSRGGLKLEKAIKVFNIDLSDLMVLDVGASTGGFTDCALQHGAARVIAVDVGYGQLAWKLRCDPRVAVLERTNIRNLTPGSISERPDFFTVDVSFISLTKVLPPIAALVAPETRGVALIKPQFEAGRENVGKKGVVREPGVHRQVLGAICSFIHKSGWGLAGLDYSPVRGPEGNIEYLAYIDLTGGDIPGENEIANLVEDARGVKV